MGRSVKKGPFVAPEPVSYTHLDVYKRQVDDKHIVAQARRGELSAFEELVTRYEKRVYAIALRSSCLLYTSRCV